MTVLELDRPRRWLEPPRGLSQDWSLTMSDSKTCTRCGQLLPFIFFHREKSTKDGFRTTCKDCEKDRRQKYYLANKERIIEKSANWAKNNRSKKREIQRRYYQKVKDSVKQKHSESFKKWRLANPDKDRQRTIKRRSVRKNAKTYLVTHQELKKMLLKPCFYCGEKSEQIDHIVPLSRGGSHSIGNLIGACAHCNHSKRNRFITEWKKK